MLDEPSEADPSISNGEALARLILGESMSGDLDFIKILIDRIEGRVPDAVEDTDSAADIYRQAAEIISEKWRLKLVVASPDGELLA